MSNEGGDWNIWKQDLGGGDPVKLTTDTGGDGWPAAGPFGQWIVFQSDRTGSYNLYLISVDGSNLIQLTDSQTDDKYPTWSPDGRYIIYSSGSGLYTIFAEGFLKSLSAGETPDPLSPTEFDPHIGGNPIMPEVRSRDAETSWLFFSDNSGDTAYQGIYATIIEQPDLKQWAVIDTPTNFPGQDSRYAFDFNGVGPNCVGGHIFIPNDNAQWTVYNLDDGGIWNIVYTTPPDLSVAHVSISPDLSWVVAEIWPLTWDYASLGYLTGMAQLDPICGTHFGRFGDDGPDYSTLDQDHDQEDLSLYLYNQWNYPPSDDITVGDWVPGEVLPDWLR